MIPFGWIFSVDVISGFAAWRCQDQHLGLDFREVALCQAMTNQFPGYVGGPMGTDILDKQWAFAPNLDPALTDVKEPRKAQQ